MKPRLTFGQRISLGFAVLVMVAVLLAGISMLSLRAVTTAKDQALTQHAEALIQVERLRAFSDRKTAMLRGFLLSEDESTLPPLEDAIRKVQDATLRLEQTWPRGRPRDLLTDLIRETEQHRMAIEGILEQHRAGRPQADIITQWEAEVRPLGNQIRATLDQLVAVKREDLDAAMADATRVTNLSTGILLAIVFVALALSAFLAAMLSRALGRQVGSAVQHLQTSSSELQASAQQQATTAKEQVSATTEVTATVRELLASSKQIGESAQRVARIAEQTASVSRTGDQTVRKAHQQIQGIKQQVDRIVAHMVELGRKSQQVGGILDIINELAEQTNILAINATIESAGAGESGKRFAVVAEEIRRLADRVSDSTKEIRGLVEEIRSSAAATTMATEEGSKAVQAGAKQFEEVTSAFEQITGWVGSTTEAAKEIELGTRQQTTAVEQVSLAIGNVSDSANEVETGSQETVQIASRLADLSRELTRMIRPRAAEPA